MGLGTTEILIIAAVLILLFGAKKLPELARGSGRALRIFKSETKGLTDDKDDAASDSAGRTDPHGRPLPPATQQAQEPPVAPRPEPSRDPVQERTPRDPA